MSFPAGLYTWLSAQASLTALVGANIYPLGIPQPSLPGDDLPDSIVYGLIGRQDIELLRETAKKRATYEFACISRQHDKAHDIAEALEAALDRYRGAMGAYSVDIAKFQDANDELDMETGVCSVRMTFQLTYSG